MPQHPAGTIRRWTDRIPRSALMTLDAEQTPPSTVTVDAEVRRPDEAARSADWPQLARDLDALEQALRHDGVPRSWPSPSKELP